VRKSIEETSREMVQLRDFNSERHAIEPPLSAPPERIQPERNFYRNGLFIERAPGLPGYPRASSSDTRHILLLHRQLARMSLSRRSSWCSLYARGIYDCLLMYESVDIPDGRMITVEPPLALLTLNRVCLGDRPGSGPPISLLSALPSRPCTWRSASQWGVRHEPFYS
jgi:hypothetical protein